MLFTSQLYTLDSSCIVVFDPFRRSFTDAKLFMPFLNSRSFKCFTLNSDPMAFSGKQISLPYLGELPKSPEEYVRNVRLFK